MFVILIFYSWLYYVSIGVKSWFVVGFFIFQFFEIMKLVYILMMGWVIIIYNSQYLVYKVDFDWQLIGKMFMWFLLIFIFFKF